ncbi:MAG: NUDIX domain-containing protein [Spirochaetaceae bacterium]|nr:MAG: NUDIX domain-containing protein [Spirochaetaceae bacterium]
MNQSVAAVALRSDTVLMAQRKSGGAIGGRWEFPGGKVEGDETHQQALKREIREELGVGCTPGQPLAQTSFRNGPHEYQLYAYQVQLHGDRFSLREHAATRWVHWNEAASLSLADSDRALLMLLLPRFSAAI